MPLQTAVRRFYVLCTGTKSSGRSVCLIALAARLPDQKALVPALPWVARMMMSAAAKSVWSRPPGRAVAAGHRFTCD